MEHYRSSAPAGLDSGRLASYLTAAGLLDDPGDLQCRILVGGYSNLTYELRSAGRRLVLRRPPLGPVAPKTHDVLRESQVLSALYSTPVPVPHVLHCCPREDVIGAPFYVMEFIEGQIARDAESTSLIGPSDRHRCGQALVDTLAAIHAIDIDAAALRSFGRPEGFVERQLARWTGQLSGMPVRRAPDFAELGRRLARALPSSERSTLLHGDFRLDNVVLDAQDPGKAVAVLDWEMATLGEPLVDLGMLMLYWGEPGEQPLTDVQAAMSQPGFPTRAEAVERYVDQTGIDLDDLDFYVVLAHFKMAVIAEGIYNRFVSGNTVGSNFERITEVPLLLLERGLELARASATFDPTAP